MPITQIALVGHCGFDAGTLTRFLGEVAPLCEVVRINHQMALEKIAVPGTLLLINREIDGEFKAGRSGIELVREMADRENPPTIMLVSNYEEAQQQAMQAGAVRGFGKSHTGDTNTRQRIAQTIAGL